MKKGTISVCIAGVFVTLQSVLILGGLYAGPSPGRGTTVAFHNMPAIVQSVVFLFFANILGIGALTLSLIAWKYHGNTKGKSTATIAIVVMIINSMRIAL